MELSDVAAELYGLPPEEFIAARTARAAAARDSGDKPLATAIKALRRPTVGAGVVNAVVRQSPDDAVAFLALGSSLRRAQADGDGAAMRELRLARQTLASSLERQAVELATGRGVSVTPAVEREVRATLLASLSDPDAARLMQAGTLTTSLTYAGFGSGSTAVAPPVAAGAGAADGPAKPAESALVAKDRAAATTRRRREAAAKVAAGQRDVADLLQQLTTAEATVTDLSARLTAAYDRLRQLERDAAATQA